MSHNPLNLWPLFKLKLFYSIHVPHSLLKKKKVPHRRPICRTWSKDRHTFTFDTRRRSVINFKLRPFYLRGHIVHIGLDNINPLSSPSIFYALAYTCKLLLRSVNFHPFSRFLQKASRYCECVWAKRPANTGSISGEARDLFFSTVSWPALGSIQLLSNGYQGSFTGGRAVGAQNWRLTSI